MFQLLLTYPCLCVFPKNRIEKANAQVITRSRTGNLPPTRVVSDGNIDNNATNKIVVNKATPEEIKEKMEQQLRIQRAAHQQKRALELKTAPGQVVKMVTNATQGNLLYILFLFYCIIYLLVLTSIKKSNVVRRTTNRHILYRNCIHIKFHILRFLATSTN